MSSEINLMFNHDQISKIYSLGYFDEEEEHFKNSLKSEIENVTKNGKKLEDIISSTTVENNLNITE